ncbi:MAG: hypothetical protein K0R89_2789, partial [Ramlibacter sp.]|nr:hypothetical protein [Ramlibacter sp.]
RCRRFNGEGRLEKRIAAMQPPVQVPFTQRVVLWLPHPTKPPMTPWTRLRQLAWTALVLAPGFVASGCTPVASGTAARQAAPAEPPAAGLRKISAASAPAAAQGALEKTPSPLCADNPWRELDELEDEFEGGGWTFWPSS